MFEGGKLLYFVVVSEISRLEGGGVYQGEGSHFLDVYRDKCTRVTIRVLVPVREHPKVGYRLLVQGQVHQSHHQGPCPCQGASQGGLQITSTGTSGLKVTSTSYILVQVTSTGSQKFS